MALLTSPPSLDNVTLSCTEDVSQRFCCENDWQMQDCITRNRGGHTIGLAILAWIFLPILAFAADDADELESIPDIDCELADTACALR